ncbi:methylated-DNA--[protein]-cysteine S-methyltransferase [Thalassotalea sp. Y01]|uniref:methylated-DNA--[protein]-cysteine S-methyltransferase n=1 Tax=Thalassotalea sp. Y01 TaxID=2729613 RepID=UPI00145CC474|nr:methylated-DNA--[protein]-cysteine S-methyltransferase [Thalassotalea sp. Y01]NMP17588.1 methylated-DNA--[protein]-cysteine S-methyltransferase [Thalassotalea sp. Y01]
MLYYQIIQSPCGEVIVVTNEHGIVEVAFQQGAAAVKLTADYQLANDDAPKHLANAVQQLDEYFQGKRRLFDLPLAQAGTAFQQKVWHALTKIQFGATYSYGQLADAIANPKAVRAVGSANGNNKIAIIVPCHRVIGSNKKLTGYAGGIGIKAQLLMHEGADFKP